LQMSNCCHIDGIVVLKLCLKIKVELCLNRTCVHNFDDIYSILFVLYKFHSDLLKGPLMEVNLKDTIKVYYGHMVA
jgi:hypothetical protein